MFTRWPPAVQSFKRDEQGSVAIIFALMSFVLFFLGGIAIDYGRIQSLRSHLADAADAASLAAGRALLDGKLKDGEIIALARRYFAQNSKTSSKMTKIAVPKITLNRNTGKVDISVTSQIGMTLTRIGGFDKVDVPVTSTATFKQRDIEVGMALDVTGSMADPVGVGGELKIKAMQKAFALFADQLIPDQKNGGHKVRIGVAPYSASVNLGSRASVASNNSVDGCVSERVASDASDDVGEFNVETKESLDRDRTQNAQDYFCPLSALEPLSDDKAALIKKVNLLQPYGSTGGHFGAQWAWNIVSDQWGSTWGGESAPASYDLVKSDKLLKAVVLMTDGVFNVAFHGEKSANQALALCAAMRAKGVIVFSVGFGLDAEPDRALREVARQTLKSCATPGEGYFADASNGDELEAAFTKFAGQLTQLRISQ